MKLQIDNYLITSDALNFTLQKYTTIVNKKDKSERQGYVNMGYFPILQHALSRILQQEIRDLDDTNIHMILDCIKQTEKKIMKAIEKYQLQKDRVKEDETNEEVSM